MAERVARLKVVEKPVGGFSRTVSVSASNEQTFDSNPKEMWSGDTLKWASMVEADVASHTFEVYTRQEVDDKRAEDAKVIAQLQEKIAAQDRDLKALSDMNDALTKRLDEIEKQLADRR
jgi:septal ring factor EnvC (AmiA/AmiB activator)